MKQLKPITHQINEHALKLLKNHPRGLRTSELKRAIEKRFPDFHPKTINGCVWKLTETYPEEIYKPERGLFKVKR